MKMNRIKTYTSLHVEMSISEAEELLDSLFHCGLPNRGLVIDGDVVLSQCDNSTRNLYELREKLLCVLEG